MKDNISPEEKLLRLIRGQKKEDRAIERKQGIPLEDIKPSIRYPSYYSFAKYLSFFNTRRVIILALVLSCLYLFASLIYPFVGLKKIELPKVERGIIKEPNLQPKQEAKPYEYYAAAAQNRQIFSGAVAPQEKAVGSVNVDLTKDINLLGIISGENPQAIIEDVKTKKTYYVTKGQFIGEIRVEDIQEGKIILNYNGESFELYL